MDSRKCSHDTNQTIIDESNFSIKSTIRSFKLKQKLFREQVCFYKYLDKITFISLHTTFYTLPVFLSICHSFASSLYLFHVFSLSL